ncbi:MAG: LysM peptidoglycan-binding domain-containing protein [Anaerostipes hadrus]|nr:LysM peptidoglycan-binding domain-containing protein [Anaerostipes hadrus]
MKTEQQLPKNIRQIGSPAGHTKVYIEDYVITFLNSLSMDKNTYVRGAILFGEKKQIGNDLVIFIRGAIEGQNLELDLDETVFDDEVWREIYQQKERLFSGLDVIGWALLRMGFSVRLNDKIKKTHFENFPGEGKVLYMMDDLEGEDAFYVFRGEDLSRQNGYYIYYEKNPMMQNYLVERRQDIKEVQTYEKMMESRRDEKLIRQFREKISKKTKSNQRKGRIRNISTAAAVTIMMIMGGTMYYYAGQDQSINFKEVVNGAVHTMGKGVSDQISTKSSSTTSVKITKTLDTATQTSTHKKEQKRVQPTTKQKQKTQKASSGQYKSYTYTVKSGETLVSISRKVYGTQKLVQRIKKANALSDENQIYPGQKLVIPGTLR